MIDSNETLMYESGRDAGYSDGYSDGYRLGYEDGVIEFVKYLKDKSFCCDSNDWHSFQAIDTDDLNKIMNDFLINGIKD